MCHRTISRIRFWAVLSVLLFGALVVPNPSWAACTTTIIPSGSPLIPDTVITTCTPDEGEFQRNRDLELQRAIILGNPPKPQRTFMAPARPDWVTRTPEIPQAYPNRFQNGEIYE